MDVLSIISEKGFHKPSSFNTNVYIKEIDDHAFWAILQHYPAHKEQFDPDIYKLVLVGTDENIPLVIGTLNKIAEYLTTHEL